jgi:hypothetical protein
VPGTATNLFVLGGAAAGGLVTALVSAATSDLAAKARVGVRIVGSWIAVIGIMTTGLPWRPVLSLTARLVIQDRDFLPLSGEFAKRPARRTRPAESGFG